jgi:hypothetical protein
MPVTSRETHTESIGYEPDLVWSGPVRDVEALSVHSADREQVALFGIVAVPFGQRSVCRIELHISESSESRTKDLYVPKRRSPSPRATTVLPLVSGQIVFGYSGCWFVWRSISGPRSADAPKGSGHLALFHSSTIAEMGVARPDCVCREHLDGAITTLKHVCMAGSRRDMVAAGSSLGKGALYDPR